MAAAAAGLPSLLAYNVSPSPTFYNQALALALWGAFVAVCRPARPGRGPQPLLLALGLLALAAAASWAFGAWPSTLALSALGLLVAAALMVGGAAGTAARPDAVQAFAAFAWGWLLAGLASVGVALVQVFAPDWADGNWVAISGSPGRAVGNLRQPNHLSSLLLWACIALVALVQLRRLALRPARLLGVGLLLAVVLSASRTGLLSVLLLALWGALDRRLQRPLRVSMLAAPVVYALGWAGMALWAEVSAHSFGGAQRLAESDISGSRFGIWANALALIRLHPWLGVGFGEFNLAWSMTPFPQRPTAFFDHAHNLPLHLAVELGLPWAGAVLALLGWALWRAARQAWAPRPEALDDLGTARRCALVVVGMIGVHSLLEYPLWYAYFLLPAAWAWGFALHAGPSGSPGRAPGQAAGPIEPAAAPPPSILAWGGAALVLVAAWAVWDYSRVTVIFRSEERAVPLVQRVTEGQRSVLFGHHADYAAVTAGVPVADERAAFARATHHLLDTRLMRAWARSLAAQGDLQAARHVADRLREFRKPEAQDFFAECDEALDRGEAPPFQCQGADAKLGWQDLLRRPPPPGSGPQP